MPKHPFPFESDEELVRDARHGNQEAFDKLVRRFRGRVIAAAQEAIGSREAAEDVAQDAFLLAYHALAQLVDPSKFAGWVCMIAKHRARRVGARDGRCEPTALSELDRLLGAQQVQHTRHPADDLARAADRAAVRAAVAQLPPEHERVLRLYYYEEWSVRRIATHLSLPIPTVKWRLHRGRRLLRLPLARKLGLASPVDQASEHIRPRAVCWFITRKKCSPQKRLQLRSPVPGARRLPARGATRRRLTATIFCFPETIHFALR